MFERLPPREIQDIINFPTNPEYQFENVKFYNRIMEKAEMKKKKYERNNPKPIKYQIGEKILIRNRELPSTLEGITKKLLLLYTGPYVITKNNNNNTYEIMNPITKKIKGTYNQAVSYTHLDVYKRQGVTSAANDDYIGRGNIINLNQNEMYLYNIRLIFDDGG